MQRLTCNELVYYQFESLSGHDLLHGVFTRLGGISQGIYSSLNLSRSTGDAQEPVRENRRRMFAALGLQPEASLTSWLVHGNHVRVVSNADLGQDDVHADGMITRERGLALTLRFADCVPILFHDPVREAIGIAHAGWLGITAHVLPATIQALRDAYGCQPADIRACIGPSIGPDKFEVGDDVAARIQSAVADPVVIQPPHMARDEESSDGFHGETTTSPRPHVDLWRAATSQLYESGVRQIQVAGLCTASNTAEWFSHRAEKENRSLWRRDRIAGLTHALLQCLPNRRTAHGIAVLRHVKRAQKPTDRPSTSSG